jgi:transcriptional regulator with XRE-family HTH domain
MSMRRVSDTDKEVGKRIKLRRLDLGLSQERLGETLGVSFQQVQKYEKGANRVSAGRLLEIATLLKVPVSFFFGGDSHEVPDSGNVFAWLDTAYSLRLMKAFAQIKEPHIQRRTVELIEAIADANRRPARKV